MIRDIINENPLSSDVLIMGKKVGRIMERFESNGMTAYAIEHKADEKLMYKDERHIYIKTGITFEISKRLKRVEFDVVIIKDVQSLMINFDQFAKILKPLMHQNSNCYIAIDDVCETYAINLKGTLVINGFKVTQEEKILKVKLK